MTSHLRVFVGVIVGFIPASPRALSHGVSFPVLRPSSSCYTTTPESKAPAPYSGNALRFFCRDSADDAIVDVLAEW